MNLIVAAATIRVNTVYTVHVHVYSQCACLVKYPRYNVMCTNVVVYNYVHVHVASIEIHRDAKATPINTQYPQNNQKLTNKKNYEHTLRPARSKKPHIQYLDTCHIQYSTCTTTASVHACTCTCTFTTIHSVV